MLYTWWNYTLFYWQSGVFFFLLKVHLEKDLLANYTGFILPCIRIPQKIALPRHSSPKKSTNCLKCRQIVFIGIYIAFTASECVRIADSFFPLDLKSMMFMGWLVHNSYCAIVSQSKSCSTVQADCATMRFAPGLQISWKQHCP